MNEKANLLIFDVEGTLIDCVPDIITCWRETLADYGIRVTTEELQRYSGLDSDDMLKALAPLERPEARSEISKSQSHRYKEHYLDQAKAIPGVHDALKELKGSDRRLALATTCQRGELSRYDRLIDVLSLCEEVSCGTDVKRGKPHPDLFRLVLRRLKTQAAAAIAVGDTPYDAMAARACGIPAIGVLTGGFSASDLREAGCAEVVADVTKIVLHP
jgi:HAD superfamily hydrolase (TIGR01509 family)